MRFTSLVVLALAGFVFVPAAEAANPSWTAGYPKPGATAGRIAVKGEISIAGTEETTGAARITAWLVGGGPMHTTNFTIPAGQSGVVTWGEQETNNDLTSNMEYWVVVSIELKITASGIKYFMSTDPAKSIAK